MTEDILLDKLRAERVKVAGNAGMTFSPLEVARQHGLDPVEAQRMLQVLEEREELVAVAQGEMWCLPEDEHRF